MILSILNRVKKLLGIEDNEQDEKLLLMIDLAIFQVESYIHSTDIGGLEPLIALLVAHDVQSGEAEGEGSGSSSSGGGIEPKVGEIKSESFYDVTYQYTTTADFVNKSSSSSGSSSSNGEPDTYFMNMIAPYLKERRHIQTLKKPYGWVADDDLYR